MKTLCFSGQLVLIWWTALVSAIDLETNLDGISDPTHYCSSVCQHRNPACLPQWKHPQNILSPCERQQEDLCEMCVKLDGIFPGQVTCQGKVTEEELTPTCTAPCSNVCSFQDMCMPAKLDRNNHFLPHCTDEDDENYPSQWCVYCLLKHSLLGNVTGKTTTLAPKPDTTVQTATTPASTVTTPPNCSRPPETSTPDPCQAFCDNFVQVCMPPNIDPCFFYYPHCDNNVEGYRPASAKCLQCINVHGLRPNSRPTQTSSSTSWTTPPTSTSRPVALPWDCFCSRLETTVIEAPTNVCPREGRYCVFPTNKGVTTAKWACSCGPRTTGNKIKKQFFFPKGRCRNCPFGYRGRCTCKRTVETTRRVRIDSCSGFNDNHGLCDLKDPSATEDTAVTNDCKCSGCRWWLNWG